MTDNEYKTIVKGRLARDDFVVDDGIGGYVDTGVDDFEEAEDVEEDEDEERPRNKCTCAYGFCDKYFSDASAPLQQRRRRRI